MDVSVVRPVPNVCEDDGRAPENEDKVMVVPPVTDGDEPASAPLEEGVLLEEGVVSPRSGWISG